MHHLFHHHDRPLAGEPHPDRRLHWSLYGCEAVATAVLMVLGICAVCIMLAPMSPVARALAGHPALRFGICGFLFGMSGTAAAYTPFGKVSGAHVNPSVTLAFHLAGKLKWPDTLGYMVAQALGAFGGTALVWLSGRALPGWGVWVASVNFAATNPDPDVAIAWPFAVEFGVTALLIGMLYNLAAHPWWRWLTPWAGGLFFLTLNPLTAWLSGNSVNLTRSLAPAVFSGAWAGFWIYVVAPFAGAAAMVAVIRSKILGHIHLPEARLINFGHHGRVPKLADPEAKQAG